MQKVEDLHRYHPYFEASGLRLSPGTPGTAGDMLARVMAMPFADAILNKIGRRGLLWVFEHDQRIKDHLVFSENLSNDINREFLSLPNCLQLAERVENSLDHGRNHFRRLEKWYKATLKETPQLRNNIFFLYFAPCAYLSMRLHDLTEVYTGEKQSHDAAAALFALGVLSLDRTKQLERVGKIPQGDWEKLIWGTAFLCQHHSKPEKIAPIQKEQLTQNLLDPNQLLQKVKDLAASKNQTIYEFFPPYNEIKETIEAIEQGNFRSPPSFTPEEIEGLKTQTLVFAATDKLDSLFPAGLSATRTALTRPDRDFYARCDGPFPDGSELKYRISQGSGQESPCDLDRFLYEITRTEVFKDLSPWLSHVFRVGLREKGKYLLEVIPVFFEGDLTRYLKAYDELERNTIKGLLIKAGVEKGLAKRIASFRERDNMINATRALLEEYYINNRVLDSFLITMALERGEVEGILKRKYEGLVKLNLSPDEKRHIRELLSEAVHLQGETIFRYPGPAEIELPYDLYYAPTNWDEWKIAH